VRYANATMFFMDDHSFPEPNAFWIGGARDSSVVLQPDAPLRSATLLVRNAPVENRVDVLAGKWKTSLTLAPGEEQRLEVPLDAGRGATMITFTVASGFRPAAVNPETRDGRFLGMWVKLEGS
jgi:hypothetical protein